MDWSKATGAALDAALSTFGKSVTYNRAAGGSTVITGVFSNAYVAVALGGGGLEQPSLHPILGIKLAHLPANPAQGDTVVIDATIYYVVDSQEDGEGGTTLVLNKQ